MKRATFLFATLISSSAGAQLHWDASVHGGASERILQSVAAQKPGTALPGPTFGLQGHVALIPFVRVGLYGSFEMSSIDGIGAPARQFWAAGAQGKILSPWPRGDVRVFATLGFGYVGVVAPGYETTIKPLMQPAQPARVDAAGGGFAEIPFGIGASYKLRGPLVIYAELLARFGLGFWGTVYGEDGGRNVHNDVVGRQALKPDGYDILSLGLVVGVGLAN